MKKLSSNTQEKKLKKIDEDIRKLVIARIRASSNNLMFSIGGMGEYSKDQMIESVEKGDELGKEIIQVQLDYLIDLAEGKLYNVLNE